MHGTFEPGRLRPDRPSFLEFVVILALLMGVTAFGVDNVLPALPAIGSAFGVSDPTAWQLVVYVYMLGFGSGQIVYGPISDVYGRRTPILVGLAIYGVGTVLTMLAPSFTLLLCGRFVQGIGAAAGRTLAIAIVRDRFVGREMARVMSLITIVFIMVPMLAPSVGSAVLALGPWQGVFGSILVLVAVTTLWFGMRLPETLKPENRGILSVAAVLRAFRTTISNRDALGYATTFGLSFGCVMTYVGMSSQVFVGIYDLGHLFPIVFGAIAGTMGIAAVVNSRLVRRYGMRRISHASLIGLVGLSAVQVVLALATAGQPPLVPFAILLGLCQFMLMLIMPNCNAMAMEPLGTIAGTAASFIGFYTTVLGALLGLVIGRAFNGTVVPMVAGFLILGLAATLVTLWTERGVLFRPQASARPL